MKIIMMILLMSPNLLALTNEDVMLKLGEMENRLAVLEKAIEAKSICQMVYKHHNYRLNRCDEGTFVRSITDVGQGAKQLECGYYQLSCKE